MKIFFTMKYCKWRYWRTISWGSPLLSDISDVSPHPPPPAGMNREENDKYAHIAPPRPTGRHEVAEPSWITVYCAPHSSQRSSGHFQWRQGVSRTQCWVGTCAVSRCCLLLGLLRIHITHCQLLPIESIYYLEIYSGCWPQVISVRASASLKVSTKFRGNFISI